MLEPGDLFPPFSPPPSPRANQKRSPKRPQQHRLFRVVHTPVLEIVRCVWFARSNLFYTPSPYYCILLYLCIIDLKKSLLLINNTCFNDEEFYSLIGTETNSFTFQLFPLFFNRNSLEFALARPITVLDNERFTVQSVITKLVCPVVLVSI